MALKIHITKLLPSERKLVVYPLVTASSEPLLVSRVACVERVIPFFWRITRIMRTSCVRVANRQFGTPRIGVKSDERRTKLARQDILICTRQDIPLRTGEVHTYPRVNVEQTAKCSYKRGVAEPSPWVYFNTLSTRMGSRQRCTSVTLA